MRFLDPTNDYAFKRIFGNEKKKEILISFLNAILSLDGLDTITDITLLNPEQAPHIKGAKSTILDVRCHDQKGAEYIVEMQVLKQSYLDKRVLYYASKTYVNQLSQGEEYDKLNPIIFLGILNFEFTENHRAVSSHRICNLETQEHIFRDFQFTLVELPKFSKEENELETLSDQWLYFLKHARELEAVPEVIHERAIQEAFEIVTSYNWSKADLDMYDRRKMALMDESARMHHSYHKGLREGEEKAKRERRDTVQRMVEQGLSDDIIAKVACISLEELVGLKSSLNENI